MTEQTSAAAAAPAKAKRKPAGPRTPSPLYIFVKNGEDGKPAVAASFRDPRKMAAHFPTATANAEHLLIVTPE